MSLFFVAADLEDGNRDAFVVAETENTAIALWQQHFELEDDESPDRVFAVKGAKIPGPDRVLNWRSDELPCVFEK